MIKIYLILSYLVPEGIMVKKLESARRSLFIEFGGDNSSWNDTKGATPASKINNTFFAVVVIIVATIVALSKLFWIEKKTKNYYLNQMTCLQIK